MSIYQTVWIFDDFDIIDENLKKISSLSEHAHSKVKKLLNIDYMVGDFCTLNYDNNMYTYKIIEYNNVDKSITLKRYLNDISSLEELVKERGFDEDFVKKYKVIISENNFYDTESEEDDYKVVKSVETPKVKSEKFDCLDITMMVFVLWHVSVLVFFIFNENI